MVDEFCNNGLWWNWWCNYRVLVQSVVKEDAKIFEHERGEAVRGNEHCCAGGCKKPNQADLG